MEVEVRFRGEAVKIEGGYIVDRVGMGGGLVRANFRDEVCTPVMPEFGEDDMVQHEPTGSVGKLTVWAGDYDRRIVNNNGNLAVVVPNMTAFHFHTIAHWPAAECTIVKKAGE